MAKLPNDRSKEKKSRNKSKKRRIDPSIAKKENEARRLLNRGDKNNIPANDENSIIFEQIRKNYTNRSVVKNIDTAFSYYKFPPTTKLNVADFSIPDQNIDILENVQKDLVKEQPDNISGYHKVSRSSIPTLGGGSWKRLSTYSTNEWNKWKENPNGQAQNRRPTPFLQTIAGQPLRDNGFGTSAEFYQTPDIIKTCQEEGKAIKFKIQFTFATKSIPESTMRKRYADGKSEVAYNPAPVDGVTYPWEYNNSYAIYLQRTMVQSGWHNDNGSGNDGRTIYNASSKVRAQIDFNNWRTAKGASWSKNNPTNSKFYLKVNLHYIIDPRQMKPYDYWNVGASSINPGWYITEGTYWEVELIDDPGKSVGNSTIRSRYYGKQVILPKMRFGGYDNDNKNLFPAIGPGMVTQEQKAKAAKEAAAIEKAKADSMAASLKAWQAGQDAALAKLKADFAALNSGVSLAAIGAAYASLPMFSSLSANATPKSTPKAAKESAAIAKSLAKGKP